MSNPRSLESIFFDSLAMGSPGERAAYLADACAGDPELLRRVQKMLEAEAGNFLEHPAFVTVPPANDASVGDRPGQRIGAYRLVQQIGEGGMGTVWRAEQLEPVKRVVALKLIKAGLDSRQVIARFEAERQALAMMDHPHIARVLDGGSDGRGRPFFVMDLCEGVPITTFCDERQLTLRERLEVFVPVCEAIQHAHQKGVIHRDVKPSNVLVTLQQGRAVPKVIDFGVAKAIEQRLTDRTLFTQHGTVVGTLEYMSPEQAAASDAGIDTRSDIYSLGVLLYELLTGTTPLTRERLARASYADILRCITEEEVPRPSTRLGEAGEALAALSLRRRSEPARLASLVRGELDWIVMKAIEKDRDRRYATAAGLAMDVQRFLRHEPVLACPPSASYLLRKFVRRHRGPLAAAGVLATALSVAIGGIGWAVRDRAAQTAEAERLRNERVARVASTVQELVAATEVQMAAQQWSEALATVRRADTAATTGDADEPTARRVRELRRDLEVLARLEWIRTRQATRMWGEADSLVAAREYAEVFRGLGVDVDAPSAAAAIERLSENKAMAVPLATALDEWARRLFDGAQDVASWQRLVVVARAIDPEPTRDRIRAVWGQPAAAARAELLQLADAVDVSQHQPVTLAILARGLQRADEWERALRLLRDAQYAHPADFWLNFELGTALGRRKAFGEALRYDTAAVAIRPDSAAAHNNLAVALRNVHRLDESVAACRRTIAIDPRLATVHANLGYALVDQGKLDEAEAAFREAIAIEPGLTIAWSGLGMVSLERQQYEPALAAFQQAIELDASNAYAWIGLSRTMRARGQPGEARSHVDRALAIEADSVSAQIELGNVLIEQHRVAEAVVAFRRAIELEPGNAVAHGNLGNALRMLGDPAKLDEASAEGRRAVELDPGYAIGWLGLGNDLQGRRQSDAAIAAYRKAVEIDPGLAAAHFQLGQLLRQQQRPEEALAEYRQVVALCPEHAAAHHGIGVVLWGRRELPGAVAELRRAVALDPSNADAWHVLGVVLTAQDQHEEAVAAYRQAVAVDPDNGQRHFALGLSLHHLRRYEEATAAYRRGVQLDPRAWMTFGVLGDVLHLQHKEEEAAAAYREAIAIDPKWAPAYRGLAQCLQAQGRIPEAIAVLEDALRQAPEDASVAGELARLFVVDADPSRGNAVRAVELAAKAAAREPANHIHANTLGVAHYRAGHWDEAIEALQAAMDLRRGGDGYDWFFLAMAHWQLGDQQLAREWYAKAAAHTASKQPANVDLRRFQAEAARLLGIGAGRN